MDFRIKLPFHFYAGVIKWLCSHKLFGKVRFSLYTGKRLMDVFFRYY
jgi:hypothetical protein